MKESISMQVIHIHADGIDVGSRSHYVAVGQDPEDVMIFQSMMNLFPSDPGL